MRRGKISRPVMFRVKKKKHSPSDWSNASGKLWYRTYRGRVADGLEHCRWCGFSTTKLTLDHLKPASKGGGSTFDNATLLCEPHNLEKADNEWPELISLAAEEAAAPPDERWAAIALFGPFGSLDLFLPDTSEAS